MAVVMTPPSRSQRCMEPPRPWQRPCSRPMISARVRCTGTTMPSVTVSAANGSKSSGVAASNSLATTSWWARWVEVSQSDRRRARAAPVAVASWPMLECSGPWTSPALSSSHFSKRRIVSMTRMAWPSVRFGVAASRAGERVTRVRPGSSGAPSPAILRGAGAAASMVMVILSWWLRRWCPGSRRAAPRQGRG